MSIQNIFNIGASGLTANRLAIEVTSQNTANVNTPGYARQRAIFETGLYLNAVPGSFGTGVRVEHIQRAYDGMLQNQLVVGSSSNSYNDTVLSSLEALEPAFNELAYNGLGQAITDYFNSWQDLTLNPGGIPERQAVLTQGQILADNFNQMHATLTMSVTNANSALPGIAAEISDLAKNIATLNGQIYQTHLSGGTPNELLSQRDYLVQQLAAKVDITVSPNITDPSDPQPISVYITSLGTPAGLLVDNSTMPGNRYAEVYTLATGVGAANDIYITAPGNPPARGGEAAVTSTVAAGSGEMAGTLYMRDTKIPSYLAQLNELADQIMASVNTQHAAGFDLNGNTGSNFFDGTDAATISVNSLLTPNLIAAAASPAGVPGDNTNAVLIAEIATTPYAFSSGTMTIDEFYNSFVSSVGIDVQAASNSAQQSSAYMTQLESLWQSNAGVSLDEELTNLIKYQQAYQGAAKLVTTATDMMDTLLGLVR